MDIKDLKTVRFLFNKSQQDVEQGSGVFQTKLSKCEKGVMTLTPEERERVENYFGGLKINWHPRKEASPLSIMERREIKPLIMHLMKKNTAKTIKWVESCKTNRRLYHEVMKILDNEIIMVRGFRYKNGRGVPDAPVMKWDKQGKPDYSHLKDD